MVTIALASTATAEDRDALEHGVALAVRAGANLLSIHANDAPSSSTRMLDPAELLRAWGRDPASVRHEELVHNCCDDPVDTLLDALRRREPDLVIAATHQRSGLLRVLAESRAEAIADNVRVPTLLVPLDGTRFVGANGTLALRKVLVPIGDEAAARAAVDGTLFMIDLAGAAEVTIELLHVGPPATEPTLHLPEREGVTWRRHSVDGDLEEAIARAAGDTSLVVMATRGHDSLRDALLGTHTERVLRRIHCPLLSVPIPH